MQRLLGVVAVFLLISTALWGQANRGSITGTVTDNSGAVVPGAEVVVTNVDTNVPTKTVSNDDGIYVVPNLQPGRYAVEIRREGFQALRRPMIVLQSTEVARIDAALQVGAVTDSVTVTADAPVLDLERPSIGTNMKGDVVTDLPLSIYGGGRTAESFAVAITPGYSPYSSPYGAVINGGQWFTKEYTVDGTSGTANIQGDSMETGPTLEAVQEMQAQTSGLDAQSALSGAGVIAFNLKSGTNKFHGSSFLYGVNELLDANTWTNDLLGPPKPQRRAWDYGFSLGGPVFKNKTFFFAAFERYQQIDFRLAAGGNSVPTAAFQNGDFSALLGSTLCNGDAGLAPCDGYDPTKNPAPLAPVPDTAGQMVTPRLGMIYDWSCATPPCAFAGNMIPDDRISAVSRRVNAFYQDYAPQFGGIDNNSRALLSGSPRQTPNQWVIKLDHVFRDQDRLSASWIYNHRPRILVDGGGLWQASTEDGGPLSNGRYQLYWSHGIRLSESHTFSPNVPNVANFTYNLDYNTSKPT
ncbi:MAG TPA: carboxypeptidase-like regulatory domain-containing protein, partial [Terriglobales bacterium]